MSDINPDGGLTPDSALLEDRLAKIRTQVHSKLDNQKNLALILSAVEENMEEQNNDKSAVSYVVSFLALLEQAVAEDRVTEPQLAGAAAYFLDMVLPFAPKALLKQKFGVVLTKLAPVLTDAAAEASLVRSSTGALETLLLAQDNQQWSSAGNVSPRRALVGMLEMSFDPRPKVRKRAQEAVRTILAHPPPSPSPIHSAAALCAELALQKLAALMDGAPKAKGRKKAQGKEPASATIHTLQLISAITAANSWPPAQVDALCDMLLAVSRTSDQYLVSSAFAAFDGLFSSMSHEFDVDRFAHVLDVLFDLKPPTDDAHLAAAWLAVIANGFQAYARLSPASAMAKVPAVVPAVTDFLAADARDIYVSAAQCLMAVVAECVPDRWLLQPGAPGVSADVYDQVDDVVAYVAGHIERELLSIRFQHATKEILEVVAAAVYKFRARANPDFVAILDVVGQWRTNEVDSFPHNKEAEDVIAACISAMGPEVVLATLPLNLAGGSGPGRAWMLPLLRDHVRFASLAYFQQNVLPLVDVFGAKIAAAPSKESMHVKVFATIVDQVWALLPHFCDLPRDLQTAFTDDFAAKLADLLYSNVDVRVTICHALRLVVESNLAYSRGVLADDLLMAQEFPVEAAQSNLAFLAAKASNMLSVLFNVFSSTVPDARGFVLDTIDTYLQIIPAGDLEVTFDKVCGLLKQALDDEAAAAAPRADKKPEPPRLSVTMMDLVVAMAKYVPRTSHTALFAIFSQTVAMPNNALMQKRAYRILTKLSEAAEGAAAIAGFVADIERVFVDTTKSTHTSARAARLAAMSHLVELLPASDLHFIPMAVQEVIMSTKDVNERSRESAYSLLIQMGRKMAAGGRIDNSKLAGFPADAAPTDATLTHFFTMVSAGLAAQSQHMISAAITALSCIVYEFKDELPQDVLVELAATVELFLTSNSREVAKSAIGFVKVEVLALPEELIRANLGEMLAKLMRWSHEHKGHFKSKVKHIVERLIRKFGADAVEQAIPEDDRKLVVNIRKSRARAKRREAASDGADGKESRKFMSAYEEAVYDSDSDGSADEDDTRAKAGDKYILDTGDEPLNLLDRQTLSHISSSKPKKFTKADVEKHNVETKNGKIVFKEMVKADPLAAGSGIDAYLDAVKQAPVRGQKNKLKFKKTKDDGVWSDDDEPAEPRKQDARPKVANKARVAKPKQKFKARRKL